MQCVVPHATRVVPPHLVRDAVHRKNAKVSMIGSWWFLWVAFMFIFLIPPIGYGWGYRGWGPPYPRYIQRRRGQAAVVNGGPSSFNHHSWGWGGDFIWIMFFVGILWAISAFWWR